MKKIPFLVLSLLTLPSYASSILGTLNQYQNNLAKPETPTSASGNSSSGSMSSTPDVRAANGSTTSTALKCEENDQTSLPLTYVTSLIQEKNGQLDISHDQRTGKLTISSADMIGNCSSMLEWTIKQPEIQGKKAYALEVKIKQGEDCSPDGCSYNVARVEKGEFQKHEPMKFKPTLKGFEECLEKSGVIANGKVVPGAIYNVPLNEKFEGATQTGKLLFLSHGPVSTQVKAKYGKFEQINGCDHYEVAHPNIRTLLTYEDAERERLDAEAAKLRGCKVEEYGKLADFIEKYEGYQSQLGDVRDRLILEAAKKAAAAIDSGKYTDEDLKVITDFDRYVVQPKVERARALYQEILDLEGDAKKEKTAELQKLLAEITTLGKQPYFLSSHTIKLIGAGKFDDAEKLNNMKLSIEAHQRLGAKENNVVITPTVASQRIASGKIAYAQSMVKEKERYDYRTGQSSGKAQENATLAKRMRDNIQARNQNFTAEIQLEYQRMQPNGYCYKYWRNTQKCVQESVERIQELQAILTHYNKVDEERALQYEATAKEYGELEAQGRRYIAAQNGIEAPAEAPAQQAKPQDTTLPTPRRETQDTNVYTFQYPGQQQGQVNPQIYQQQAQMMPQQYQQPIYPYQNNNMFAQQQSPYGYYPQQLGQQAYNFNWNNPTGAVVQQPYAYPQQQMPYYNNPVGAYGNYNYYYGRSF